MYVSIIWNCIQYNRQALLVALLPYYKDVWCLVLLVTVFCFDVIVNIEFNTRLIVIYRLGEKWSCC